MTSLGVATMASSSLQAQPSQSASCDDSIPPVMPTDVARNIVQRLSCRDICAAASACRAFYSWASACSSLEATCWSSPEGSEKAASLLRFLAKRSAQGLEVSACYILKAIFCQQPSDRS